MGYQCLGDMSEWTKCTNKTDDPERKPFIVPDEFKEQVRLLALFNPLTNHRVIG